MCVAGSTLAVLARQRSIGPTGRSLRPMKRKMMHFHARSRLRKCARELSCCANIINFSVRAVGIWPRADGVMCDREGAIWRRLVISRRRACGVQKLRDGLAMFIQGSFTRLLRTVIPRAPCRWTVVEK